MNNNQLWPSEQASTRRYSNRSTVKAQTIKTSWTPAILMTLFIMFLVATVLVGLYHFVLADLFSSLSTVTDVLDQAQRATGASK